MLIVLLLIALPVVAVGVLKGRYVLSLVGLLVLAGVPAMLAACRLARADSWWARRYYDEAKLARSRARYPGNSSVSDALTL